MRNTFIILSLQQQRVARCIDRNGVDPATNEIRALVASFERICAQLFFIMFTLHQ